MEVTVRYFTVLRKITRKRHENLEMKPNSTVEDMLMILTRKYGESFERYVSSGRGKKGLQLVFLLNGRDVRNLDGLKTRLNNGDTVAVMPPIAGG
jgi:molybdopterin synthase sulfur carrier subunit